MAFARFNVENVPTGIDNTQRRLVAYGTVTIMPDEPEGHVYSYTDGGLRIFFSPMEPLKAFPVVPKWVDVQRSLVSRSYAMSLYPLWTPGYISQSGQNGGLSRDIYITATDFRISMYHGLTGGERITFEGFDSPPVTEINGKSFILPSPQTNPSQLVFTHPLPAPMNTWPTGTHTPDRVGFVKVEDWGRVVPGSGIPSTVGMGLMKLIDENSGREFGGPSDIATSDTAKYVLNDVIRFRAEFVRSYQ